ncbi:MAG TPA: DNA polymerase III subunit delta [Prolixibacteraceae bacterium]|nr:DNA polymerase III subunit delta [Prolixibacteraceae bacterium]HRV89891.1 DNA polymerase III subunit delta [Prolixibacteraceae bacterium]
MEHEQILASLKNKIYHPVYFLCGEEPYYADMISDYIEHNLLPEAEKSFNQTVFYGKDTDLTTVIEASRRYPMMANHQVIIVKEAQAWKNLKLLVKYLEAPMKSTILVINYKYAKPDGRTPEVKEIQKKTVYLETKKLRDYQVPAWVDQYVKSKGSAITPQASQMLTDFLGTDLSKIANELNKLFLVVPPGQRITPDEVEKNIGISKEYNAFELTDALGSGNILKANRIVNYFGANPSACPMQPTMGVLFSYFVKLFKYHFLPDKSDKAVASALGVNPYIVRNYTEPARRYGKTRLFEIFGILREYDLKSKGLGTSGGVGQGELLKEMVYKIMH